MQLEFHWVREDLPGDRWVELFERTWSSYEDWFLREGDAARPDLETCRRRLTRSMPELVPLWERLVELAGGGERAARMLSLYSPTPYLAGCSQAVWTGDRPALVRNYDYHPALCEYRFLESAWTGTRVLASSDCLWGVLDGMNEHGLVVALAFGGSRRVGDGFGIPLILRYVLETCRTVVEAGEVLRRIPSHMAYNVSLLDASGDYAVAALAPGRPTQWRKRAFATNHQDGADWKAYLERTRTVARQRYLSELLSAPGTTRDGLVARFLTAPLYSRDYARGSGTLYTVVYEPTNLGATYLWPDERVEQSLVGFEETSIRVQLEVAAH